MEPDELLHALGRFAKEQAREEPAALAAAAEDRPPAADQPAPEGDLAALLAPLSEERLHEITTACLRELHAPAPAGPAPMPAGGALPRPRLRKRMLTGVAGVVLVLSAALVVFVRPSLRGGAMLPSYDMEVTGGTETTRGSGIAKAPLHLRGNATLQVVLRPRKPYDGAVTARAFLVAGGEEVVWPATVEAAPSGALRLVGTIPVPRAAAQGELIVVVGKPGALPNRPPAPSEEEQALQVLREWIDWR